jgi:hypothetical protein
MVRRGLASLSASALVMLFLFALQPLAGQTAPGATQATGARAYAPPRTADGQPDLQGVWANNNATPLERPKELGDRAFLTDEEVARLQAKADQIFGNGNDAAFGDDFFKAALADDTSKAADRSFRSFDKVTGNYSAVWLVDRQFDNRTSLITDPKDGRVPPLTPAGQQRMASYGGGIGGGAADGPEDRPLSERCITFGLPDTLGGYNSYYQILQTPGYVVIATERIHDARIVPLDGRPHAPSHIRLWNGDSRGRREGNTLVVDTTNFSSKTNFRGSSENLHLIERFTRVSPTTIQYEFTVEDPTTWTRPWTAMIPLKKTEDKIYEYACHEGNTGMEGVLSGARFQDAQAATKTGSR